MCRTTDSSFQSSNTLNNTGVRSLIAEELASLYSVPLSVVNGLSHLTMISNWQAWPIQKFLNPPIFKSAHHFWIELERPIQIRVKSQSCAGTYLHINYTLFGLLPLSRTMQVFYGEYCHAVF